MMIPSLSEIRKLRVADLRGKLAEIGLQTAGKVKIHFPMIVLFCERRTCRIRQTCSTFLYISVIVISLC